MKKKAKKQPYGDVDISHPKNEEPLDEGTVAANGSCVVPNNDELIETYGCIERTEGDLPTDYDMYDHELAGKSETDGAWSFPVLFGARVGENWVKVLCRLEQPDGRPLEKSQAQRFTGTESRAKKRRRTASRGASMMRGIPQDPEGTQLFFGKWYLYRHLAVTDDHYGNRLMVRGNELRGSHISIFAEDLLWRTEENGSLIVVRRPTGNGVVANDDWRFRRANRYSLCVHQARGWYKMVRASSFVRPTRIRLDADWPIYINVNDLRRPSSANGYRDNSGSFDVWVRVDAP